MHALAVRKILKSIIEAPTSRIWEKSKNKHKKSRRKETIKIKAEINEIENKNREKLMRQTAGFLERLTDKLLGRLTKEKREKIQSINISNRKYDYRL